MEEEILPIEGVLHLHHVIVMELQLHNVDLLQQMLQLLVEIMQEMHVIKDVHHKHLHHHHLKHLHNVIVKDKQEHNVEMDLQVEQQHVEIEYLIHAVHNVNHQHLNHLHL
jgi:hypothetical protein